MSASHKTELFLATSETFEGAHLLDCKVTFMSLGTVSIKQSTDCVLLSMDQMEKLGVPLAAIIGGCLIMSGRLVDPMPPAVQHGLFYILLALVVLEFRLRRGSSDD